MHIVITYDPDVSTAPAGFTTAVNEAVAYLDQLVTNNISFTIEFGWGTSGAINANQPGAAAISEPAIADIFEPNAGNEQPLVTALNGAYATNGLSGLVTPGVLNADFATASGFTFFQLGYPEALALNVLGNLDQGDTSIGYVALNSTVAWDFDTRGAGASFEFDAVSALLHEITHTMGRVTGFSTGSQSIESLMDFFRYTSNGQLDVTPGNGFFSLNGGAILYPFEPAGDDPADWTQAIQQDANGFAPFGNAFNFSAVDQLELRALGFQLNIEPNTYLGDDVSEAVIENASGSVVLADLSGGAFSFTNLGGLGSEWKFVGSGDFLGDGVSDALIENASGAVFAAEDVGGAFDYTQLTGLGPEWTFHGAGDFLGDQNTEFLIENTSGAVAVGRYAGNNQSTFAEVTQLGSEWAFKGVGDFLGDGKTEFLIENTAGAVVVGDVAENDQTSFTQVSGLGPEWSFREVGDFLGDGQDDYLIQNTAGAVFIGEVGSNDQAAYTQVTGLGPEWKFVGAGDYLGEGHDQFLIENSAGAVVVGDFTSGAVHFTQVAALGPEWAFH